MQHNNNPQLPQYLNHRSQQLPMSTSTGTRSDPYTAYAAALMSNQVPMQQTFQQQQTQQHEQVQHKLAQLDEEKIYTLVLELLNPNLREQALLELSKKREQYEDLALILWHSFGKFLRLYYCEL
jgi:CCR4-NOT transcription complex subunit 9